MPKLLVFAPCEKVIIDTENNASVITILQEVSLDVQIADKLPDAAVPITWYVFALWMRQSEEEVGRRFEESCDLIIPGGKTIAIARNTFTMPERSHRSVVKVLGFPIFRTPGEAELKLSIREAEGGESREVASFPLLLNHQPPDT